MSRLHQVAGADESKEIPSYLKNLDKPWMALTGCGARRDDTDPSFAFGRGQLGGGHVPNRPFRRDAKTTVAMRASSTCPTSECGTL